jgi:hypothetical protein
MTPAQRGSVRNLTRRSFETRAFFTDFTDSILGLGAGAFFASAPFQRLFGSTMKMTTMPAHVTLPGLMGNRISAPYPFC